MPRNPKYAGDPATKNRYRQRVHNWTRRGLIEGHDYTIENGVPIRVRHGRDPPPHQGRPLKKPPEHPPETPTDAELIQLPAKNLVDLPYEASVRIALLKRKWDLEDATSHGVTHPVDSLPPLPDHLKEELRLVGDLAAAYYSRHHPHPYGADGD